MRNFLLLLSLCSLCMQGVAGPLGEVKSGTSDDFKKKLVGHFTSTFEKKIESVVDNYNQLVEEKDAIETISKNWDEENSKYLLELKKENSNIQLSKIVKNKDGSYILKVGDRPISFDDNDILLGRIKIGKEYFEISQDKNLAEIQIQLETLINAEKSASSSLIDSLFLLMGISQAQAAIPLVVIAVMTLIGAVGTSFWFKSKSAKLEALKDALSDTHEKINEKVQLCEESESSESSYDNTFDLMSDILNESTDSSASGAFFSTMLADENKGLESCEAIVDEFIRRTVGNIGTLSTEASEINELKTNLCGEKLNSNQLALSGRNRPRFGSYVRLNQCLERFHDRHVGITNRNRQNGRIWIDSDTDLIRNQRYYNGTSGR